MPEDAAAPQVSIIVPVYNVKDYIPRCLTSIQQQTLAEWECICVDDGSTDGSGAVLDEYAAKDARFVVIHKENGGTSTARNAGLDVARGEYIGFVDPDDWIEAETYEAALEAARRTDADIVQWGFIAETENESVPLNELPEGFFDAVCNSEYFTSIVWDKLFRSNFIFENEICFPHGIRLGEDISLCTVAYALAKKCFFLNKKLYHNDRTRQASITRNVTPELLLDYAKGVQQAHDFIKSKGLPKDEKRKNEIEKYIFMRKLGVKRLCLSFLPKPDCRLFRAIFPELNGQMLRYFFYTKRPYILIMVLATWHLDAAAVALLRLKQWKKAAKAKFGAKR